MDQPPPLPPSGDAPPSGRPVEPPKIAVPVGQAPSRTSTASIMALVLGILSFMCCGFLSGIPAFFIGRSELKAIDEGRVDASNRPIAKIGMIVGLVGAILSLLVVVFYIVIIALGIGAGMMQNR